jgi:hypothetical protein
VAANPITLRPSYTGRRSGRRPPGGLGGAFGRPSSARDHLATPDRPRLGASSDRSAGCSPDGHVEVSRMPPPPGPSTPGSWASSPSASRPRQNCWPTPPLTCWHSRHIPRSTGASLVQQSPGAAERRARRACLPTGGLPLAAGSHRDLGSSRFPLWASVTTSQDQHSINSHARKKSLHQTTFRFWYFSISSSWRSL